MPVLYIHRKLCLLLISVFCFSANANQVDYRYNLRGQLVAEKRDEKHNYHNLDALGNRLSVLYGSNGAHLSRPVLNEPANGAIFNFRIVDLSVSMARGRTIPSS